MIICGNSKEVLKEFPDNYFDSVVTDPPYGLTSIVKRFKNTSTEGKTQTEQDAKERKTPYARTSKGFMGKEWDGSGIEYDVDFWREVYRVLKPGGHMLVMSGTRTYHRVATAIEDAGFEIRDMLQWLYGCLSEDTEILTINGWMRYNEFITENPVLCYNLDKDQFEFHKPKRSFIYENKHTAYRIKSDSTDQIVSRNHRVLVEQDGRNVFKRNRGKKKF